MPEVILGIDAGTAHTGLAAIHVSDNRVARPHWCAFIKTKLDRAASRRSGRALDDQRRLFEVIDPILSAIGTMRPAMVAYEEYTTYDSTEIVKVKDVAKRMLAEAVDFGIIEADNGRQLHQAPTDECLDLLRGHLRQARTALGDGNQFVGVRGKGRAARTLTVVGSIITACRVYGVQAVPQYAAQLKRRFPLKGKTGTIEGVCAILPGTEEMLAQCRVPPSDWNHVYDAWGHALLAAGL